jgi:hypothetical protein
MRSSHEEGAGVNADTCMTKDEIHERRIEQARIRMVHAETDEARRKAMSEFLQLCEDRSPEQKARMEAERMARVFGGSQRAGT